jgi:hypothetical protein
MMIRAFAAAAAASLCVASHLGAQSVLFLDRSYVVRMTPELGLMYEGQTTVPLVLRSSLDRLYSTLTAADGGWSTANTLVLTPMFRIRQLTEKAAASQPVRTPSFMPKLTAQFLAARRLGGRDYGVGANDALDALVIGVDGTFGHYSNGQAGCFRANERREAGSDDCVRDPAALPGSDTLNTIDGSFSTWYLEAQMHVRFARFRDARALVTVTLDGGVDWHPAFLAPIGGMDTALAAVYGRWRPFGGLEVARRSEWGCPSVFILRWVPCGIGRVRASSRVEYIGTRPLDVAPVTTTAELAWTFARYAGFGPIVRVHQGQDYYNIALGHELNVIQYGFTFDFERNDPIDRGARMRH